MVASIRHMKLEALQLQTGTTRQAGAMAALTIAITETHLAGATEMVAGSYIDMVAQEDIGTDGEVFQKRHIPTVESRQRCREAQRSSRKALGDAYCHIQGQIFMGVGIGLDLSTQIACRG